MGSWTVAIIYIYLSLTPYIAPSLAPAFVKADPDRDGLFNDEEEILGTNPLNADTDNDGLEDGYEFDHGTSPVDYDTDGDGLGDGAELDELTDPLDIDSDNDGLEDGFEVNSFGSNPRMVDTDLDKLSDKQEQDYGTDPLSPDTDGDGATDYDEIFVRDTNPLSPDLNVMLKLRDIESNSEVRNVMVFVDGTETGTTSEEGTILCEAISIGQHRVSIVYVGYGSLSVGNFTVENENSSDVTLLVDMPNPELSVDLETDAWTEGYFQSRKVGKATVTVSNNGNIESENTMAIVTVYNEKTEKVTSQELVKLGNIAADATATGETGKIYTTRIFETTFNGFGDDDSVFVVIYDNSEYLPQRSLRSVIGSTGSVAEFLLESVSDYMAENSVVGTIVDVATSPLVPKFFA